MGRMTRYVLLLRGINVGTKNSLPMAELRAMLEGLDCVDVKTYIQSGNAVFGTKLRASELTKAIEAALTSYMGRPIATTLRTDKQLEAVVNARPFAEVATNLSRLCVTFLSHAPTAAELAPLYAASFEPELFEVAGKELFTWHPEGQAKSALATTIAKLKLRGAVTTRNFNTVIKLLEMIRARD